MKKLFFSMGLMLAASALTNCAKDDTAISADKGPMSAVNISANLAATRTEITRDDINSQYNVAWKEGDKIYVSAFTEAEKAGATWTWGKPFNTNAPRIYTYTDGAFTMPENGHIPDGAYTFTAIYADASQATYPTSNKLLGNQKQDCNAPLANLANYDCMVGTASVTIPDAMPTFTMKHIYSWLKITVSNATTGNETIESINVTSQANLAGVFNITDFTTGEIEYGSGAVNTLALNLENAPVTAAGGILDTYLVMAPMTMDAVNLTITVTTAAGNTYTKTNSVTNAFEAGKAYGATFTMDASSLVAPTSYELATADGAFVDGGEYIFAIKSGVTEDYCFLIPGTTSANTSAVNELTVTNNTISTGDEKYNWTATASGAGFTFKNSSGTFISYTSGTNLVTQNNTGAVWIPTFLATGHYQIQFENTTGRYWAINNDPVTVTSGIAFKAYALSNFINQFNPAIALKQNCGAISVFKKGTN